VSLKQQDAPCWILAHPDGTPAGQWEERHFSDEDEAADVLDCEDADDPGFAGVAPRELPAPCLTIVCDGCGEPYKNWPDDYLIGHFANPSDAWADASDVRFAKDGTTWCEDCAAKLPVCVHCDQRITGAPVIDPEDRSERKYCSDSCLTSDAEAVGEQAYPSGVAT
jgi:hypothetical protein